MQQFVNYLVNNMAKFSKEWCEIWDPKRIPDYSIEEVVKDVLPERHYPITCYGFGFVNIQRDRYGILWLGFPVEGSKTVSWSRYASVLKREVTKKNLIDEASSFQ